MSNTEWTKQTWTPTVGGTPVSEALTIPLLRQKPTTYFVDSMSDLFCEDVPDEFIAECFAVMHLACWHRYQVLTKRPKRMAELLSSERFATLFDGAIENWSGMADDLAGLFGYFDPLHRLTTDWRAIDHAAMPAAHVWLGTSVEDQPMADERIPHLLNCPAAVRFLSCEPLLGPVDIKPWLVAKVIGPGVINGNAYTTSHSDNKLDWVIVGGESGKGARPCNVAWIRSIVEQCKNAGVPVFVKQLGAKPYVDPCPKGADMSEFPEDLRVREFPATQAEGVSGVGVTVYEHVNAMEEKR